MPSNHILINNGIEYFVNDGKMDELIQWLRQNGHEEKTGIKYQEPDELVEVISCSQIES